MTTLTPVQLKLALEQLDISWCILPPGQRTNRVWSNCVYNWTGGNIVGADDLVVAVNPNAARRVRQLMWANLCTLLTDDLREGCERKFDSETPAIHQVWSYLNLMAEDLKESMHAKADHTLQQLEPLSDDVRLADYDGLRKTLIKWYTKKREAGENVREQQIIRKFMDMIGQLPNVWAAASLTSLKMRNVSTVVTFSEFYSEFRKSAVGNDITVGLQAKNSRGAINAAAIARLQKQVSDSYQGGRGGARGGRRGGRGGGRGGGYEQDRAERLCFNCHLPGHFARDCESGSDNQFDRKNLESGGDNQLPLMNLDLSGSGGDGR